MVNTVRDTRIPVGGLADAVNTNIRLDGTAYSRNAWELVLDGAPARDMFKHNGLTYCVLGNDLVMMDETGSTALMGGVGRINWSVLNDKPVFINHEAIFEIDGSSITKISEVTKDQQDMDDVLVPMPGGHWLEYWNGRLIAARGRSLLFSQPLRYGAHNPLTDYIQFPTRIEWIAPLESGIYVGLRGSVRFLSGNTPAELSQTEVAEGSAPGMALVVSSEFIAQEVAATPRVAVFFTSSGFTVGLPNGQVVYPQKETLRDLPLFRGKLVQDGNRIFAIRGF